MILIIMMLVYFESGIFSVIKKDWKGEIKFGVMKMMYRVLMVRIVLLMREVVGCGIWIFRVSKVSLDE